MSSGMPAPQNFQGIARQQSDASKQAVNQQTLANRPTQSSPFATTSWQQGPNGEWMQSTNFNGALGGLNTSLQAQAASAMSSPFDLSGLPALTNGEAAREQAINASYGSATSRLDPQFQAREQQLRSQLEGQGLAAGSEAYNNALAGLGRERNDAYGQALNSAIGQGTQAGQALFQQSLAGRQNSLSEMLRQRGQAFSELQGLQGLTQQQGFNGAGLAQTPDMLGAAQLQGNQDWQRYQAQQQQLNDYIQGGFQLAGAIAPFALCDDRVKLGVTPLGEEVLPGVELHAWEYMPGYGEPGVHVGVLAQQLASVMPAAVREREDGLLEVHPHFAPMVLE